jgi:hypothetical protein
MNSVINTLKQAGYTVYAAKHSDGLSSETSGYVFAITPSDNVLYVQRGNFGGWEISLQYPPTRKNGTGCRDNEGQPYAAVTLDVMQGAEQRNLRFARELHAMLYKSSEEWKSKYWTELVQL